MRLTKGLFVYYLYIGLFGALGALLRALLGVAFEGAAFPIDTLFVNVVGCFALELVYNFLGRRVHLSKDLVGAMGTGLLGAFTTMSAFSYQTVAFLEAGEAATAACYIVITLALCLAATTAGHLAALRIARRRLAKRKAAIAARREARKAGEAR